MIPAQRMAMLSRTQHHAGAAVRHRKFAFRDDQPEMYFRVKGEGVNMAKLAGGVFLRTERRQDTFLEGMGPKSIDNCLKAVVLVNKFAQEKRKEESTGEVPWFHRVGFVPQLRKTGTSYWLSMKVVGIKGPYTPYDAPEQERLRVGQETKIDQLTGAVRTCWTRRCAGERSEPLVCAMGPRSVSLAVKSMARCLKEMNERKGVLRLFLCHPDMIEEVLPENGNSVVMTHMRLEPRPRETE
ncbi:unnamed protein product [Symbiodinium necroappetens]|uniref:Uncharacterized protein n=1 Tax=Symbiodinium necroappetens TaxID=1628268 RepID=A0A812SLD8_9DINO|nr:unnamed protein product [Symbiodinium necroappetens]